MDTRGVVVAGTCPRCEETSAPTAERMITCAKCGLRFDTHAKAGSAPPKKPVLRATAPRTKYVVVDRTRERLVLRFRRTWIEWVVFAVLVSLSAGMVVVGIQMPSGAYPMAIFMWIVAALVMVPVVILAQPVVIRVDADEVRADAPFHHPRISRAELDDVIAQVQPATARRVTQYVIVAVGKNGSRVLMHTAFADMAAQIVDEIDRAVAEIPATGSSSR